MQYSNKNDPSQFSEIPDFPVEAIIDEELLDYLNELTLFEDDELKDDEDLGDDEDLPPEI